MSKYFPKPKALGGNVKVDLKNATGVDTSDFPKKFDFASLKSKLDKLDMGKLETTPVDLSKLNNKVENDVLKKTEYDELVIKFNAIHTADNSNLVNKTDYDTKIGDIEKNIYDQKHDEYITTQELID